MYWVFWRKNKDEPYYCNGKHSSYWYYLEGIEPVHAWKHAYKVNNIGQNDPEHAEDFRERMASEEEYNLALEMINDDSLHILTHPKLMDGKYFVLRRSYIDNIKLVLEVLKFDYYVTKGMDGIINLHDEALRNNNKDLAKSTKKMLEKLDTDMTLFAKRAFRTWGVKEYRAFCGFTQEYFAKLLEISTTTLRNYETGRTKTPKAVLNDAERLSNRYRDFNENPIISLQPEDTLEYFKND